jgi:glycosyltransferase involved in cell wall biosynthesis
MDGAATMTPRAVVYDQFWSTAGGGEKVAAGMAAALRDDFDVTLLGHEPIDLDDLGERLQLDLSRLSVQEIEVSPTSVEAASVDYDLLVNASYTSSAICASAAGLYYVHFPHAPSRDVGGIKGAAVRALRPMVRLPGIEVEQRSGFQLEEMLAGRRCQWTTGEAVLLLTLPRGEDVPIQLDFGRFQPKELDPIPITVTVDDDVVGETVLTPRRSRLQRGLESVSFTVRGREDRRASRVLISSTSIVPAVELGTNDRRRLGVPFAGVQVGDAMRSRLVRRYPSLAGQIDSLDWLRTYDRVLANSQYTQQWITRWWHVDSEILHPPVTQQPPLDKQPIILNVGRFFAAEQGHSKKQLELVRAFRELCDRGVMGWELHLVGGCSDEDWAYLERVRHAAGNLPVHLHVNASGAELRSLYGRAGIYWHASGMGEDPDRHPDRFEHFGITTVEAMSAGAVPIVYGQAGQLEVVDHAVTGYHFKTEEQLVQLTRRVIGDEDLRHRLAGAAEVAAERDSFERFSDRVRQSAASVLDDGSSRRQVS